MTAPAEVTLKKQSAKTALLELTIHEGRKHQVRRMCAAVGLPVEELHRRRYGPITDKGLEPGGHRELNGDEIEALRRASEEVAVSAGDEVEGKPVLLAAEAPAPPRPSWPRTTSRTSPRPTSRTPPRPTRGSPTAVAPRTTSRTPPRPMRRRARRTRQARPATRPDMYTSSSVPHPQTGPR